jgi:ribonuclease HI
LVWPEVEVMKNNVSEVVRIYTDGAGKRPDGNGSGFAWVREDTRERHVERIPGLSNNEAEYRGVISAIKLLPEGCQVEVLSDSLLVVSQLGGEYRIRDPKLEKLAAEVKTIAEQKQLLLKVTWIPRGENQAGKLL